MTGFYCTPIYDLIVYFIVKSPVIIFQSHMGKDDAEWWMDVVDGLDQEGLKAHDVEGEGGEQCRHLFLYRIIVINCQLRLLTSVSFRSIQSRCTF